MLFVGTLIAVASAIGFEAVYHDDARNLAQARTVTFCIMVYSQLFYAFACRSYRYTMPELGFFTNPYLFAAIAVSILLQLAIVTLPFAQPLFEAHTHTAFEWALLFVLALAPVTVLELGKIGWKLLFRSSS